MAIRLGVPAIVTKPFIGSDVEQAIEEHLAVTDPATVADSPREIPLNETHSFVRSSKRMRDLEGQPALGAPARTFQSSFLGRAEPVRKFLPYIHTKCPHAVAKSFSR